MRSWCDQWLLELNPEKVYVDTQVTTLVSISGRIGGAFNEKKKTTFEEHFEMYARRY